jgi:hypothetical protein
MPSPNRLSRPRRALVASAVAVLAASAAGCTNPRQMAYLNDQLNQAADAVADIRTNMSIMQSSMDSLRLVVAKQDSIIAKIAAVTNVQIIK